MQYCIAAIQMTSSDNVTDNLRAAEKLIQNAVEQGAKLVVLPEMFAVMGLDQMDKVKAREEYGRGPIQDFLSEQAVLHQIWIVGGTIPLVANHLPEKVYAATLVFDDHGRVVARYDKIHLFDVSLFATQENYFESKTTTPGEDIVVVESPFGKLGLAVCYDVRFPEMFRHMHDKGVDIVILPSAFTFTTGAVHWDILVRARAIENQVYVIAAAQTGTHTSSRKTYGHSMIVDPWGAVKAILPQGEGVVVTDIDLNYLRQLRKEFPVLEHRQQPKKLL